MGKREKMTEEKLIQMIRSGYGQGHGDDYRPFLKNTRAAISKQGTQSSAKVLYGFNRSCDFKSRQEKNIARALLWLGALDIREQFPIWPWPHPHPLLGTPGVEKLVSAPAPGLIEIAEVCSELNSATMASPMATCHLVLNFKGYKHQIFPAPCWRACSELYSDETLVPCFHARPAAAGLLFLRS